MFISHIARGLHSSGSVVRGMIFQHKTMRRHGFIPGIFSSFLASLPDSGDARKKKKNQGINKINRQPLWSLKAKNFQSSEMYKDTNLFTRKNYDLNFSTMISVVIFTSDLSHAGRVRFQTMCPPPSPPPLPPHKSAPDCCPV